MPVIRISCLPETGDDLLRQITEEICGAVGSIPELELDGKPGSITVLIPKDMMHWGLGEEIIIEIFGLFVRAQRTDEVRARLAAAVGKVLYQHFPRALVECFVQPFNPKQGFWSSRDPAPTVENKTPKRNWSSEEISEEDWRQISAVRLSARLSVILQVFKSAGNELVPAFKNGRWQVKPSMQASFNAQMRKNGLPYRIRSTTIGMHGRSASDDLLRIYKTNPGK